MILKHLLFYQATWRSVFRIGLWCLLFLYAFGTLIPPLHDEVPLDKTVTGTPMIPMLTIMDDSRTFLDSYVADPKAINIAWVSDSSGIMLDYGKTYDNTPDEEYRLFPARTAERLQQDYGLDNIKIPLYLRLSTRPVDALALSLLALRQKPDIIIIPVNSVWSFSHYQVANRDKTMPLLPTVFGEHPRLWPMLFAMCAPMHHLWSLAGRHIDIIKYASPLKGHLQNAFAPFLESFTLPAQPKEIKLDINVSNIPYWILMNMMKRNIAPLQDESGSIRTVLLYHQVIRHDDPYMTDSWATDSFHAMIDILKESGVPVLIYAWPLSDTLRGEPETLAKIEEMTEFLKKENAQLKGSNVRIISQIPEDVRKTMDFRKFDDFHIHDEGKLDDFLAREIWLMLKDHSHKVKDKGND